jgi:hypothetical protein
MAVRIKKLDSDSMITIKKELTFLPNLPPNRYQRNVTASPVALYNEDQHFLYVPLDYYKHRFASAPPHTLLRSYSVTPLKFTGTLREQQVLVEEEAWQQLKQSYCTTLGLYPGFGKTILGAKLASRDPLLTVVLVHREILTNQWKKTFTDFTNARVWIVGEKHPPAMCDVIICMDTRWDSIPAAIRDRVGFLIVDEAHAFCTPTHVGCLLAFRPKYVVIETATLLRDDEMHKMVYAIAGQRGVYRETSKPFSVIKVETNTSPERKMKKRYKEEFVDWAALVKDTLLDERRNKIITDLVQKNSTDTILILTSLVEHTMLLYNKLLELNISCDYMCGTRKIYKDCRVLIGTTSKIGTGFDQATACPDYSGRRFNLLILACSIKKYAMLVQNVGRVFRADYPTVMHLVDNDTIFESHWQKARKWFVMHNGKMEPPIIIDNPKSTTIMKENKDVSDWAVVRAAELRKELEKNK